MSYGPFAATTPEERARQLRGLASILACAQGSSHPAIPLLRAAEDDPAALPAAFRAIEGLPALTLRKVLRTHQAVTCQRYDVMKQTGDETMDINAAFPSKYVRASDLGGRDVRVTIDYVEMEMIQDDEKPVVYFKGKNKAMVLNRINSQTIATMHGTNTDNWGGREIVLFPARDRFGGKMVDCIRVREHRAQQAARPQPQAAPRQQQPQDGFAENREIVMDDEIPF